MGPRTPVCFQKLHILRPLVNSHIRNNSLIIKTTQAAGTDSPVPASPETTSYLLWLRQSWPVGLPRTQLSETHLRFVEWSLFPKECCGTSCACHRWREWSHCPAPQQHLPTSGRRRHPSSANKSALQCSSSSLSRRKHAGQRGLLRLILPR